MLVLGILPFFLRAFPRPADLMPWALDSAYLLVGVAAVVFGIVAFREASGRARRRGFRSAEEVTVQGALLGAFVLAWAGMATLTGAAAGPGGVVRGTAERVVALPMEMNRFAPPTLRLRAGSPTAVVLVNRDPFDHGFDIDSLGIHVSVPARSTVTALVESRNAGRIPFYCGEPGHREAGMTGAVEVRQSAPTHGQRPTLVSWHAGSVLAPHRPSVLRISRRRCGATAGP